MRKYSELYLVCLIETEEESTWGISHYLLPLICSVYTATDICSLLLYLFSLLPVFVFVIFRNIYLHWFTSVHLISPSHLAFSQTKASIVNWCSQIPSQPARQAGREERSTWSQTRHYEIRKVARHACAFKQNTAERERDNNKAEQSRAIVWLIIPL